MKWILKLGLISLACLFSLSYAQEAGNQSSSVENQITQLKSQLDSCRSTYKLKVAQSKAKLEKAKKSNPMG
ncbi:MAG: hypothetical protein LUC43_05960, partial [Burkholderiales bacterium]|nr:hypothetical protein [Burkholderiales bacterium]